MNNKIVCPYCSAEYDPSEIFVPSAFFGKPDVIRNEEHGIERVVGKLGDLTEEYTCDYCNNAFRIEASVDYCTKGLSKVDFREKAFVQKLKK